MSIAIHTELRFVECIVLSSLDEEVYSMYVDKPGTLTKDYSHKLQHHFPVLMYRI